jgi:protein phosphatase
MVEIESAGITHVGMKREGNEDALFLNESQNLYVVADGMGGHQAGEVASALVVDTIRDFMKRFQEDSNAEEPADPDDSLSTEANRLLASIHVANRAVHDLAQSNASYHGMGSTVSGVYFTDDTLVVANVGDSPIYLIHDGHIELVSVTHNVITEQMAIDPDAARKLGPRYRHMLTRAMGIGKTVVPDVSELPYFKGDMLVISSDGLSDKVAPAEIRDIVTKEGPAKAGETLVDLANERGGDDNITIIILKVTSVRNTKNGTLRGLLSRLFPFIK